MKKFSKAEEKEKDVEHEISQKIGIQNDTHRMMKLRNTSAFLSLCLLITFRGPHPKYWCKSSFIGRNLSPLSGIDKPKAVVSQMVSTSQPKVIFLMKV
ncbi:hypothetical protein Bpfe_002067 [Biomphalaria pfeifferi]|uniref:Uncharacterized protein n=1 Tax=Biomphalaria pfeifferi TaxID=112525 RepID=A0AAD8FKC0_BIOPF|nr:hypothetical protein Bpfe_014472 [Biomphalaria pfeifferi]KAK0068132.1 hypothetical protein Bpfe_002067 [Biomphalaria pfeifferi]